MTAESRGPALSYFSNSSSVVPAEVSGDMEKHLIALDKGATCSAWNYCSLRMAAGATDGTVSIYDSPEQGSPSFVRSFKWKAHEKPVVKLQWVPPEYGDAVACICADGTVSLWEEIEDETLMWKLCKIFEGSGTQALDLQFGVTATSLKLVIAYSDGHVKVYELLDPLELNKWQLQAEFQNVIDSVSRFVKPSCSSASIAWIPQRGANHQSSFALGFNSDLPQFNSSKVWEFDEAYQRWLPVADLALPGESDDPVYAIGWAPNIGRPYEVLAVATSKGITIWHLKLNSETDGRLPVEKVALLSGHDGEVWQLEWDMGGMTLASAGSDGMVRLWQANLKGVWHEQATLTSGEGS